MRTLYDVIVRPVISEKATALAEVGNRYVFEVASKAKKQEIRDAIQKLFNVKVESVRTLMMQGKSKRFGMTESKKANWKKAIVTLKEGNKIDFFNSK